MPPPTEVVGIGSCGVDRFAIVPRLAGADEKINAERMEIHAGGVTGNNLTQAARLGATAQAGPPHPRRKRRKMRSETGRILLVAGD